VSIFRPSSDDEISNNEKNAQGIPYKACGAGRGRGEWDHLARNVQELKI
jgi:hypothetical protein